MNRPSAPGFYWYRMPRAGAHSFELWCVRVEIDDGGLVGWLPFMDFSVPMDDSIAWRGEWLGRADPP